MEVSVKSGRETLRESERFVSHFGVETIKRAARAFEIKLKAH